MSDLDTASLFFSLLGVIALVGVLVAVPTLLLGSVLEVAGRGRALLVEVIGPVALPLALVVAVVATAGSLWFSEVVGLIPCRLCWYQRALIYPQVGVLTWGIARGGVWPRRVSLTLASLGLVVSSYHYALEWFPSLDTGSCSVEAPCSFVWFRRFGFLSLPALAWLTSASIAWLVLVDRRAEEVSAGDGGILS